MSLAINGHSKARPTAEKTTMARRVLRDRSIKGPRNGETIAKGAMVKRRYNNTFDFASVGEIEKKSDPASEIVTSVSPAIINTWTSAKRPKGVD